MWQFTPGPAQTSQMSNSDSDSDAIADYNMENECESLYTVIKNTIKSIFYL